MENYSVNNTHHQYILFVKGNNQRSYKSSRREGVKNRKEKVLSANVEERCEVFYNPVKHRKSVLKQPLNTFHQIWGGRGVGPTFADMFIKCFFYALLYYVYCLVKVGQSDYKLLLHQAQLCKENSTAFSSETTREPPVKSYWWPPEHFTIPSETSRIISKNPPI